MPWCAPSIRANYCFQLVDIRAGDFGDLGNRSGQKWPEPRCKCRIRPYFAFLPQGHRLKVANARLGGDVCWPRGRPHCEHPDGCRLFIAGIAPVCGVGHPAGVTQRIRGPSACALVRPLCRLNSCIVFQEGYCNRTERSLRHDDVADRSAPKRRRQRSCFGPLF